MKIGNPFTPGRRDLMARTLLDTWKLLVTAALATGFFLRYNTVVSAASVIGGVGMFIVFTLIFPSRPSKGGE